MKRLMFCAIVAFTMATPNAFGQSLADRVGALEKTVGKLGKDITQTNDALKETVKVVSAAVTDFDSYKTSNNGEVGKLKNENADLRARVDKLERDPRTVVNNYTTPNATAPYSPYGYGWYPPYHPPTPYGPLEVWSSYFGEMVHLSPVWGSRRTWDPSLGRYVHRT